MIKHTLIMVSALIAFSITPSDAQTNNQAAKSQKSPENVLRKFRANKDEMRDITFYEHKTSPRYRNSNGVHIYFSRTTTGRLGPIRLVMQYHGDDWLFIKKAWAKADGETVELPQTTKFSGWERDNEGGMVWEWSDAEVGSPGEMQTIRKIAEAKSSTIRFEGKQYYHDVKLTQKQKAAMREVISAYEELSGRPWGE